MNALTSGSVSLSPCICLAICSSRARRAHCAYRRVLSRTDSAPAARTVAPIGASIPNRLLHPGSVFSPRRGHFNSKSTDERGRDVSQSCLLSCPHGPKRVYGGRKDSSSPSTFAFRMQRCKLDGNDRHAWLKGGRAGQFESPAGDSPAIQAALTRRRFKIVGIHLRTCCCA